jgi:DNA modification methylase
MSKKSDSATIQIFTDRQPDMFEKSYEETLNEKADQPVECLGMTFQNDEERRKHFLDKLREKLKDPDFRKIDGFPLGSDEDILALSDPPYYTACPNPFIADFIKYYGKPFDPSIPYSREPFAADVSEGKNDPIYNAHTYHTKVPHKAIMRYILHYTEPGDFVFDGFCGTGMTGVAAQLCGDKVTVESLGYRVDKDGTISQKETDENEKAVWKPFSKLGSRRAVLNDLSPAATFIAYNYNTPVDVETFEQEANLLLKDVEEELGWMYKTTHTDGKTECRITYAVWSDVFACPDCAGEVVFWDVAVDQDNGVVRSEFQCPKCNCILTKRSLKRAFLTFHDHALGFPVKQAKQIPVLYNYTYAGRSYTKKPDRRDTDLLQRINELAPGDWFPMDRMPEGDESRRNDGAGITHAHHFYTKRNRLTLARCLTKCPSSLCRWLITGVMQRASKQHQIAISRIGGPKEGEGGATAGHRRGTLYIPSNQVEFNPVLLILERLKMALKTARRPWVIGNLILETASTTRIRIENDKIDYIFTDPPFGGNIMYSELNFIWESTLKIKTNSDQEAITNKSQEKALIDYQMLMYRCFSEYFRTLKPGCWMTVEFHNSQNAVWSSIQEALQRAGFVIADVRVLDKKIKTHTQRTAGGSVNKDLAISAYKPNGGLEERFKLEAGTYEGVWDFVRTHLKQLPVFVSKDGQAEVIAERQDYLLFDRMVAFHVQRGVTVPLSAAEFYAGLVQRFSERDGMYFHPEQVAEYDKKRMTVREVLQLQLFVTDEASAIQWLKQQLIKKPQTFQEIHPQFLKEIGGWHKYEKALELSDLLDQNFLRFDGKGDAPSQIHSYLSTNFKELRNLPKDDERLHAKGKDRWYVPDPNKAGDLEKLRERSLLKEFEDYRTSSQKRLKVFRLEAVRAGFKKAWQDKSEAGYRTIIEVAKKIPENVIQEDPKLLMWYDQALTRMGGE